MKTVIRTATESCPSCSTRLPRLPVRYARTIRYMLEREQKRKAAISVGFRPAAHSNKIWNASREPYRARRSMARIWTCSSGGISSKVVDGIGGGSLYVDV